MVRPLSKDEQSELDKLFGSPEAPGSSGSGGVFGSTGGALSAGTQGGKFSGETAGTGFVNASQYLDANKGKGAALGEKITAGASGLSDKISGGISEFKGMNPGSFAPDAEADKAADETLNWNSSQGGKKTSKDFEDAENYYLGKKGSYKSLAGDLDARYEALQGLKGMGDDWKRKLDPNSSDARGTRSSLLKDAAKSEGLYGYGDNAQAFDSMFMESESPDLISKKYNALEGALSGFAGLDTLLTEKKAADFKKGSDTESYYGAKADQARTRKEATREREQRGKSGMPGKGDLWAPIDPSSSTTDVSSANTADYKDPVFGGGDSKIQTTTYPDGTREEYNEFTGDRVTTYPDGSKRVVAKNGMSIEYNADGSIKEMSGGFT